MISLFELFWVFFYVGAFTIGGGLVAITLMQQEILGRGLISPERFYNMVAISESTPGPIGVNMATYIGYETHGVIGGIVTTIGTVLPSIIVILIIARVLEAFRQNKYVDAVFYGLRPCSVGLIAAAGMLVVKIAMFNFDLYGQTGALADLFNFKALALAAALVVFTRFVKITKKLHPIVFIAASAAVGIIFSF